MRGPLGELVYSLTVQIWRRGREHTVTAHVHDGEPAAAEQQHHEVGSEQAAIRLGAQLLYLAADQMAAPSEGAKK